MEFINITHNLETLSKEQESEFKTVETLLGNLNSTKPTHEPFNKLEYKNQSFKVVNFGFAHKFLLNDIEKALSGNIESHKVFILEEVRERFKDYDRFKTPNNHKNLKTFLEALIKYYSNYPKYSETDEFKNFIVSLSSSIQKELSK